MPAKISKEVETQARAFISIFLVSIFILVAGSICKDFSLINTGSCLTSIGDWGMMIGGVGFFFIVFTATPE